MKPNLSVMDRSAYIAGLLRERACAALCPVTARRAMAQLAVLGRHSV